MWTPHVHRRCFLHQRMALELLWLECKRSRGRTFGALPLHLLRRILCLVEVATD